MLGGTTVATTPNPVAEKPAVAVPTTAAAPATDSILAAMLSVSKQVSDLIFSPGRPP